MPLLEPVPEARANATARGRTRPGTRAATRAHATARAGTSTRADTTARAARAARCAAAGARAASTHTCARRGRRRACGVPRRREVARLGISTRCACSRLTRGGIALIFHPSVPFAVRRQPACEREMALTPLQANKRSQVAYRAPDRARLLRSRVLPPLERRRGQSALQATEQEGRLVPALILVPRSLRRWPGGAGALQSRRCRTRRRHGRSGKNAGGKGGWNEPRERDVRYLALPSGLARRAVERNLAETQGFEPWIQVLARMLP